MKVVFCYFDGDLKCVQVVPPRGKIVETLTLPDNCDPRGMEYADLIRLSEVTHRKEYEAQQQSS